MRKTKQQKAFDSMQLLQDDSGREYLFYISIFGPVKDYSPWTIADYKKYKNIGDQQQ